MPDLNSDLTRHRLFAHGNIPREDLRLIRQNLRWTAVRNVSTGSNRKITATAIDIRPRHSETTHGVPFRRWTEKAWPPMKMIMIWPATMMHWIITKEPLRWILSNKLRPLSRRRQLVRLLAFQTFRPQSNSDETYLNWLKNCIQTKVLNASVCC